MQTYRCTGRPSHEWTNNLPREVNVIALSVGAGGELQNLCPHCLVQKLGELLTKLQVGQVIEQ